MAFYCMGFFYGRSLLLVNGRPCSEHQFWLATRQFPAQTLTGKPRKQLLSRKRSERKIEMNIEICKRKQKVGKEKPDSF